MLHKKVFSLSWPGKSFGVKSESSEKQQAQYKNYPAAKE